MSKAFKQLVDKYVQEAGGDKRKGHQLAAQKIDQLIADKKLDPARVSLKGVFESTVGLDVLDDHDSKRVAEAINTSAFPVISERLIHQQIIDEYDLQVGEVNQLVRERDASVTTSRELVAGIEAGDMTPLRRPEGMAYEETSFGEKHWEIRMADFGRMISLTREMIWEDRTGEVQDRARDIGRAAGQHRARMIIETLEALPRTAFDETEFEGAIYKGNRLGMSDLYSEDHSNIDGVENDNLALNNELQDYTDIDNVMQLFADMKDEAGQRISITPTTLIVPMALRISAYNIMNTTTYMFTGGENISDPKPTINPIQALGNFNVISSIWLSSNTNWYLGSPDRQMLWLNVFAPETRSQGTESELAFTNQILARYRFSYHGGVGHTDYRYIVKSVEGASQ